MLLKFSKRQFLEEFRNGYLYMKPQADFAKMENDPVRGDRVETVDEIFQQHDIKSFRIGKKEFQGSWTGAHQFWSARLQRVLHVLDPGLAHW